MKYLLVLFFISFFGNDLFAQSTNKSTLLLLGDSVKVTNCDSAELIIENHTQNVPGFLFNTGNGRTVFKRAVLKINDSLYLIGADTVKIPKINGTPWLQGGNAFGATGVLGTLDNNNLDLYTKNLRQARLDTSGNFLLNNGAMLIGVAAYSGYKLDMNGPARISGYERVSAGDGYDISSIPSYLNMYDTGVNCSVIAFGAVYASVGVNKQLVGNIPAGSLIIGGTSPYKITTLVDYNYNPAFIVDGSGAVTINGGYNGIKKGGALGNGIDAGAQNFNINGGRGTGAGFPGDIVFSTGTSQTSGTSIHQMTNRWWLKGGTGNLSNSSSPTSTIDITGVNGYSQFRLRNTYTPTSSSDTNGNLGDFSWDSNYLYIKTSSGWKRTTLTSF